MKAPRAYYEAIATLTGCIIGAGIFGIPYVVVRSGFWTGMLVIVVLGLTALIIHLLAGEVSLRSSRCQQLVGYSERYLGAKGKFLMSASMVIGVYGAMVAYTIGVSRSLTALFGGYEILWAVLFYIVMGALLHGSLHVLERSEIYMEIFKFLAFAVIIILLFSSSYFSAGHFVGFAWDKLLLPYGVILFAYLGTAAIPEVREETKTCKILTKKAIIIGSLIPVFVYALFTAAVVGVTGGRTTEVATIGLAPLVGDFGAALLHIFAVLAMASSFIALGFALKDTYRLDFKLPRWEAWLLTMLVPVVLIALGVSSFVRTLQVAGTFAAGIAGITIVAMHIKAKKRSERKPEYRIRMNWIGYSMLIILFALGMLYQLLLIF